MAGNKCCEGKAEEKEEEKTANNLHFIGEKVRGGRMLLACCGCIVLVGTN